MASLAGGLVVALVALAAVVGEAAGEPALATIGGEAITVEHFEQEMARRGGGRPGRFETVEERRALLDEMVAERLRVEAARAAGYERDPEIVVALERLMAAKLERDLLEPRLVAIEVSDEEIAAAYAAAPELYTVAEQVRAAVILLELPAEPSADQRVEVDRRAQAILAEAREVEPAKGFGDLARRHSADRASRYVGGVVGWLVRGDRYRWGDEVVETAFDLGLAGDVAAVDTAGGRYLVRLIERRPAKVRPLAQVAGGIRRELVRQRRAVLRRAFYDQLRRDFAVEVDAAAFDLIGPPAAAGPPPVVAGN